MEETPAHAYARAHAAWNQWLRHWDLTGDQRAHRAALVCQRIAEERLTALQSDRGTSRSRGDGDRGFAYGVRQTATASRQPPDHAVSLRRPKTIAQLRAASDDLRRRSEAVSQHMTQLFAKSNELLQASMQQLRLPVRKSLWARESPGSLVLWPWLQGRGSQDDRPEQSVRADANAA